MRYASFFAAMVFAGAVAVSSAGCFFDYMHDCEYNITLACFYQGTGTTTGTGGDCIPSESNKDIENACGVFVSSSLGGSGGAGTKEAPFATIDEAVTAAGGKPIYLCGEALSEELKIESGEVTVYGALDCAAGWIYEPTKKTTWTAEPDKVPLFVGSAASVAVFDVKIEAASAQKAGGSSIAVIADEGAELALERCEVVAGDGQDGEAGTTPTDYIGPSDPNDEDIKGFDGTNACTAMDQQFGGAAKENPYCPLDMGGPLGGSGGTGTVTNGEAGEAPAPGNAQTAQGGVGQAAASPTLDCGVGDGKGGGNGGSPGAPGNPGPSGSDLGTISASGYMGATGGAGLPGTPGQGGGGGGGTKGKAGCAGASGGGGGAGGCGGKGGTGGQAGGASLGIVSLNATVTLTAVTIVTGQGGKGGAGGPGQGGAVGGSGGQGGLGDTADPPTLKACDGGAGGQGGKGGGGGGGRGGPSVGIAFNGFAPAQHETTITPGGGGTGGLAGNDPPTNPGLPGLSCQSLNFGQGPASCVP